MHSREQIAWNNLKLLRKGFDKLLKQFGGKIPDTKVKAVQFSEDLYTLVDHHTSAAGFIPPRKMYTEPPKEEKEETGNPTVFKRDEITKGI